MTPNTPLDPTIRKLTLELTPVRPTGSSLKPAVLAWLAAFATVAIGFFAMLRLRSDLSIQFEHWDFVFQTVTPVLAALLASWAVQSLGIPGRTTLRRQRMIAFALPAALALLWAVRTIVAAAADPVSVSWHSSELSCTVAVLALSLLPGAWLFYQARRSATTTPAWSGALVGLTASSLSAGALALHCTNDTPWHLLTWHLLLPLGIAALIGQSLGRRLLRW